jgi:membrane fusion protein, multidrug efflux system
MNGVSKRGWLRGWWVVLLAMALVGLTARAIVNRKAEQKELMAAAVPAVTSQLKVSASDVFVAARVPLNTTVPISGSVMAVDRVLLKSRLSGELKSLTVREGDTVKRGQLLGRIDADEYNTRLEQARQQAASAQAQWQIAQRTLDNNKALVKQGFISQNALDTSISNAAGARANLQAAQAATRLAQKSLSDTQLISPINGLVSQQFVQAGERVSPDARVLEVVNLSRMEMETALKPEIVAQVQVGTEAVLTVDGMPNAITAQVVRINPSADAVSRAVMVYLSVPSAPGMRHGLFAQGYLKLSRMETLAVPPAFVRRNASGPFLQVLQQGRVTHRAVRLGEQGLPDATAIPMIAVVSGLQAGERVLHGSLGMLRDGTLVQVSP